MQPDVLDRLGLPIVEVGAVQVAVEAAQLHWPSGEARVVVLLQSAFDAHAAVELTLQGSLARSERAVRVLPGEVRRARMGLWLPGGVEPIALRVKCRHVQAPRLRPSWTRSVAPPPSLETGSVFRAALRQALGKRKPREPALADEEGTVSVVLEAVGGEPALAAEEEALWQPGMPVPEPRGLRAEAGRPMGTATLADAEGEMPECRNCFTRQYRELVIALQACPTCGQSWRA